MDKPNNLLEAAERIVALEKAVADLTAHNNILIARQIALQSILNTALWGWGKSREEVAGGLTLAGANSLDTVREMTGVMHPVVASAWNAAYATLTAPGRLPFVIESNSYQIQEQN